MYELVEMEGNPYDSITKEVAQVLEGVEINFTNNEDIEIMEPHVNEYDKASNLESKGTKVSSHRDKEE